MFDNNNYDQQSLISYDKTDNATGHFYPAYQQNYGELCSSADHLQNDNELWVQQSYMPSTNHHHGASDHTSSDMSATGELT